MPSHQPTAGMMAVDPDYVKQPSSMASTSEPNRNPKYDPKKPHITDTPITKANWYKHVNWLNVSLFVNMHPAALANVGPRLPSSSASLSLAALPPSGLLSNGRPPSGPSYTTSGLVSASQLATIASGHTSPTTPLSHSASSLPLLAAVPLRVPSAGGAATTVPTTATPTPTRTHTASARDFSTAILAGWS
jgi:hypothetical protein